MFSYCDVRNLKDTTMRANTCIDVSALIPVAGLSAHGGHVGIDLTE